jgi:hypothetical protein
VKTALRVAAAIVLSTAAGPARADTAEPVSLAAPAQPEHFPRLSVETDPSLLLLNGYGFSIGGSAAPHWHVLFTQFAFDLYGFATPSGWHARVDQGNFLWLKYYLRPSNDGLFVGAAFATLGWDYTRDDSPGQHALQSQYGVLPFVGYRWFPTHSGLFLQPWVGLALTLHTVGQDTLNGNKYEPVFPVFPLAAVHVGYEWGR